MDTSKSVFQLHGVNEAEVPILLRKLRRAQMISFLEDIHPTTIGIEAGGAAHYWARTFATMGHEVRIMAPQFVKPYVKRGKNDAADAEALCEAMNRPTMRFVSTKTAAQQAALMLVSIRDRLIRSRTQLTNSIRGYAAEFGLITGCGVGKVAPFVERVAEDASLPELARSLFRELGDELTQIEARIGKIDAELKARHRQDELSQRLAQIPGVGTIGATMLALKTPDPQGFRSARHFAAWIGLTPRDHSTGGKNRLGAITKAGDETLRSILVVGATAVISQIRRGKKRHWPWLERLIERKPPKLVAIALANKLARIAWKLMASGQGYHPGHIMNPA
ncbi:transposase [Mesorhizobium sp. Root552]|uniref:IS110 family transposase n=1 Tax=Mesorhizobium sp. Root552 TaxID=1736555 RepID=UPI0006F6E94B|nr:IS110 family transposase [Mesorhizobium sp. Root552]KQZ18198.1 transposase [Mesorhizobium sp. Root552]